jgi:hypothetical protein
MAGRHPLQQRPHAARVQPVRRVLLQQAGEHGCQRAGVLERWRVRREHGGERLQGALAGERRDALGRDPEGDAERPQVGRRGRAVAASPLGRDEGRRADQRAGGGGRRVAQQPGDPEVGEDGVAHLRRPAEHDVRRLDVAVQHAGGVRGVQRVEQPQAERGDLRGGQRPALRQLVGEGARRQPLHDHPGLAVLLHDVVDEHRRRRRQPCRRPRLVQGPLPRLGDLLLRQAGRAQHLLDGDRPAQQLVLRGPDDAHPASAQHGLEPVPPGDPPLLRQAGRGAARGVHVPVLSSWRRQVPASCVASRSILTPLGPTRLSSSAARNARNVGKAGKDHLVRRPCGLLAC